MMMDEPIDHPPIQLKSRSQIFRFENSKICKLLFLLVYPRMGLLKSVQGWKTLETVARSKVSSPYGAFQVRTGIKTLETIARSKVFHPTKLDRWRMSRLVILQSNRNQDPKFSVYFKISKLLFLLVIPRTGLLKSVRGWKTLETIVRSKVFHPTKLDWPDGWADWSSSSPTEIKIPNSQIRKF